MGWSSRLALVLAHRRWPWAAALLGVLLTSPALGAGALLDDHLHRFAIDLHLQGEGIGAWWDLYSAAEGDEALTRARIDQGFAPWWTVPDLRLRFWRPVSAATHYLDHGLWGDQPWLMHAHSLAWYAALVVGVGALLRRWLGPTWIAGLGTLLFALDDAHAMPAGWVAQRNALVGAVLTVATLWVHDRARRDGWRPGTWLGPLLLGLALLANEASVAALGYLVALALWLEPANEGESRGRRLVRGLGALLPYVAVVAVWRLVYDALGYGAQGSGVYLDPVRELGVFAAAAPDRIAALGLSLLARPEAEHWSLLPHPWPARGWASLLAVAVLVAVSPALRRRPGVRVCLVGAVMALVPAAASVPNDRLLLLSGVGGSAVVASVVGVALGDGIAGPWWQRLPAGLLALPALAVHLVMAPVGLVQGVSALPRILEEPQRRVVESLPADPRLAEQDLVIVNSPPTFVSSYLWLIRWGGDPALPRRLRVLGSTFAPVVVQRTDDRTLVLQPVGGYFADPWSSIARGRDNPFTPGDRVALDGLTVEVLGVVQGRPTAVRMRFDRPLEDESLRWVAWRDDRFEPFVLPPVGRSVAIPGRT